MLRPSQRLIGLYILCSIYFHEDVKTTPFYQLILDLLARVETLRIAEQKMLIEFVKSVPKFAKQTPVQYIREAEAEAEPPAKLLQDLEPYQKAHSENMPTTNLLNSASLTSVIRDEEAVVPKKESQIHIDIARDLDIQETCFNEVLPPILTPINESDESYLIDNVLPI